MMWQMPTSPSDWKEIRLRLSRSSPQTIGYRTRLSTPKWDWRKPTKRTSDHGSALSGTGRWLALDPSTILATEASISDWHLGCIVAFGRATVMEWIVLGFLLMHLLLLFGVLGGLLHTLFPRGCRNKSRGDRKGYSMQKAMPHGPDADLRAIKTTVGLNRKFDSNLCPIPPMVAPISRLPACWL